MMMMMIMMMMLIITMIIIMIMVIILITIIIVIIVIIMIIINDSYNNKEGCGQNFINRMVFQKRVTGALDWLNILAIPCWLCSLCTRG